MAKFIIDIFNSDWFIFVFVPTMMLIVFPIVVGFISQQGD